MNDKQLIDAIAQLWIASGGDATGFEWCWFKILERIVEILEDK